MMTIQPINIVSKEIDKMSKDELYAYNKKINDYMEQLKMNRKLKFEKANKITLKKYLEMFPEVNLQSKRIFYGKNNDFLSILCFECKDEISYEREDIISDCYCCDSCNLIYNYI